MELFEYFNLSSNSELIEKITNKDESVKELLEFYEYIKTENYTNIKKTKKIDCAENLLAFIKKYNAYPNDENEIIVIGCDVKLSPLKLFKVKVDSDLMKNYCKALAEPNLSTVFIIADDKTKYDFDSFDDIPYKVMNVLFIDDKKVFSCVQNKVIGKINRNKKSDNDIKYFNKLKGINSFKKFINYDEFTIQYSNIELLGKHYFTQHEEIKELLRLGYENSNQEHFVLIKIDKDFKIYDIRNLFKGGTNSSEVDPKVLLQNIFADDKCYCFSIVHNHPSGEIKPSNEDNRITEKINELSSVIEIPLIDHFIVGNEGVYSFKKETNYINYFRHEENMINDTNYIKIR